MTHSAAPDAAPAVPHRWWALVVLAVGLGLIVIDGTIVGVSLPTIIADLDLAFTQAQWVNTLYSVIFAALLLTAGRLGDLLGRRTLFVAGVTVFVAGSVWASTAGDATALISARLVQGVGGALVLPATLSTVNAVFRGKDRAAAFGVWGAVISGAAAVGPLLGGWLTDSFGWRWIFLINVPLGIVLVVAALWLVPQTRAAHEGRGLDLGGLLLSVLGFGTLVFAVIEGATLGWWRPLAPLDLGPLHWSADAPVSVVPIAAAVAAASLVGFVLWERHRARAGRSRLLDLTMFYTPTFSWGNIAAMMVAIGEFGLVFVLPLFLVNALGLSVLAAGGVLSAMAVGAFLAGASARHLAATFGAPTVVVIGLVLEVLGALQLAAEERTGVRLWLVIVALVIYGIGLGLASAQLTSTVLGDIPVELSGQASATQSTVRQVGAALGSAIVGAVLSLGLAHHLGRLTGPAADLAEATRASAGGTIAGLREQGAPAALVDPLAGAFADATRWALFAAVAFLALGLLAALRVRRAAGRVRALPADAGAA